jgi:hypothetical protein
VVDALVTACRHNLVPAYFSNDFDELYEKKIKLVKFYFFRRQNPQQIGLIKSADRWFVRKLRMPGAQSK